MKQTISTIKSIKDKIPNAKIILIEGGLEDIIKTELISIIDKYIYLGNIKIVRWLVDSKLKGLGEACMLLFLNTKNIKSNNFIIKISGRYILNKNFKMEKWKDKFNCRIYKNTISTRLYGFPSEYIKNWSWVIIKSLPFLLLGSSIEREMYRFTKKNNINALETLGVGGYIAPTGEIIYE